MPLSSRYLSILASGLLLLQHLPFSHSSALPVIRNKNSNPVIAVVPNAWHLPIHWSLYNNALHHLGYETSCHKLASTDALDPSITTVKVDSDTIRNETIMPLLDAGREVVVVAHSYSGSPAGTAARGLSLPERKAQGLKGGVIGLIYIAALVVKEGQSLEDISGGTGPSPFVTVYPDGQLSATNGSRERFFDDVPEPIADWAVKLLKNESRVATETPSPGPPAWGDDVFEGRRAFVICDQDKAVPAKYQPLQINSTGVEWDVKHFNTSHSPFLSQPKELAKWTAEEVWKFQKVGAGTTVKETEAE